MLTCGALALRLVIKCRDIKPENFMLSDTSDKARIKACDFGALGGGGRQGCQL